MLSQAKSFFHQPKQRGVWPRCRRKAPFWSHAACHGRDGIVAFSSCV